MTFGRRKVNWIYAGVYADDAISGTGTEKRGEFNRLIADCDAGRIEIVLVKSISCFARNTVDPLNTVRHLKGIGVEVWFEDEGIHSLDGDGELMLTILASFAQEESRSISENCKWGIRKQYERGASRGCKIYGYRTKRGQLVILPQGSMEGDLIMSVHFSWISHENAPFSMPTHRYPNAKFFPIHEILY